MQINDLKFLIVIQSTNLTLQQLRLLWCEQIKK